MADPVVVAVDLVVRQRRSLLNSLGAVVNPCEPTCAVHWAPLRYQPPPGALVQACRRAVVLQLWLATTVITLVAL